MIKGKVTLLRKISNKLTLFKDNAKIYFLSVLDSFVVKNNTSPKTFKKIILPFTVYGSDFINAFLSFSLPSILQDRNIPNISNNGLEIEVIILTKNENEKKKISENSLISKLKKFASVNIHVFDHIKNSNQLDIKVVGMFMAIDKSIQENAPIFWSAPDDFYGDGSISNLISLMDSDTDFIFSSHPRVKWSTIEHIKKIYDKSKNFSIENKQLVKIAIENLVDVQKVCFDENEYTLSGVRLKTIDTNTTAAKFSRIAPVFGGLIKSDLTFFRKFRGFNYNDFLWSRKIQKEGRMKIIGDSDIFFKVELTHKNDSKNDFTPSLIHKDLIRLKPYGGKYRLLNHKINEIFISFWKK